MTRFLFVTSILSILIIMSVGIKLNVLHEWKYVDFFWDNPQQKQEAIDFGYYDPSSVKLYDADRALDGRIFVTAAKDKGVPASVMTVTNENGEGGPLLRPYPDWSWYEENNCNSITAGVYGIFIKCNHLFIMDSGRFEPKKPVCLAQIFIFDLSTDKLIKRVIIPSNISNNRNGTGLLASITVIAPHCENIKDNAIIFMADSEGYGLIVYNSSTSKFCRIEHKFMKPTAAYFTIANQSFYLPDGIIPITIIYNDLYYTAVAGYKMIKMEIPKLMECPLNDNEINEQTQIAAMLSGQTGPITSEKCALFFSNLPQTSIMCADATKDINNNMELIVQDSERLQFPSGLKYLPNAQKLLILTNRYQRVLTNTLNLNETNYRVLWIDQAEIQKETKCFDSCK
ncbi:hypothetical protein P5V15_002429 [Pogonomyrmex californicus]